MDFPLTVSESHDGCVPRTLESVIHSIQDHVGIPNRNQVISGLFYVLMQECGYILMQPSECDDAKPKSDKDIDGHEKRLMTFNLNRLLSQAPLIAPLVESPNGPYKLPLQLAGVQDYRFKLLITPSADDYVVVNLLVVKEDIKDCFSIALHISAFVPNPKSTNIGGKFSDLRTLSVIFKDNIAHKGRSAVLNAEGIVNNSLVGLMDEVKHKIVKVLSVSDLLNLSATCQSLLAVKRDQSVWKALLLRDFNHSVPEEQEYSVESLIATYQRLRTKSRSSSDSLVSRWSVDVDDDFNFDREPPRLPRHSPSYEFHPYFIMNIHSEVRSTNNITLPQSDYQSHTRIQTSQQIDCDESNKS